MADIASMLAGLFGGGQPTSQGSRLMGVGGGMPGAGEPEGAALAASMPPAPPPAPVDDPLGGNMLKPAVQPPPGGVMEMLKGLLGGGKPAGPQIPAAGMARDPEGARLAADVGGAAMMPQPAPGGPAADPTTPIAPGDGRVVAGRPTPQPMTAEFQRLFAGGDQGQGGGAGQGGGGAAPAVGGPWQTQTTPAAPAVTGEDVSRFIRSIAAGAASVKPGAGKFAAFAQGANGALQTSYGEEEKEKAAKTKAAGTAFDQNLKTEELGLKKNQDARADRKEGREEGVSNARINYLNARAAAALRRDGSLDNVAIAKIEQHMRVWAKAKKDEGMSGAELDKAYETEFARQKAQYTEKKIITPGEFKAVGNAPGGAPAGGKAAAAPAEGTIASNKQTGEKLIFQGGRWVPMPAQ